MQAFFNFFFSRRVFLFMQKKNKNSTFSKKDQKARKYLAIKTFRIKQLQNMMTSITFKNNQKKAFESFYYNVFPQKLLHKITLEINSV